MARVISTGEWPMPKCIAKRGGELVSVVPVLIS